MENRVMVYVHMSHDCIEVTAMESLKLHERSYEVLPKARLRWFLSPAA
jgi:hypothetical protein